MGLVILQKVLVGNLLPMAVISLAKDFSSTLKLSKAHMVSISLLCLDFRSLDFAVVYSQREESVQTH